MSENRHAPHAPVQNKNFPPLGAAAVSPPFAVAASAVPAVCPGSDCPSRLGDAEGTTIGSGPSESAPMDLGFEGQGTLAKGGFEGGCPPLSAGAGVVSLEEQAKNFWRQKIVENKLTSVGVDLDFEAVNLGSDFVKIPDEDWISSAEDWEFAVVGIVFGAKPAVGKIQGFVRSKWGGLCSEVSMLRPGVFLFNFRSRTDRDKIMDQGPWMFDSRPLVLKHWIPGEFYSQESVESLPVWVRFPDLSPHLRRPDNLGCIASAVGKPICMDGFTVGNEKLMFARVLIEIYAARDFKYEVVVGGPNGFSFTQQIIYEWLPSRCNHCLSFGHSVHSCRLPRIEMDNMEQELDDRVALDPGGQGEEKEDSVNVGQVGQAGEKEVVEEGVKSVSKKVQLKKNKPSACGEASASSSMVNNGVKEKEIENFLEGEKEKSDSLVEPEEIDSKEESVDSLESDVSFVKVISRSQRRREKNKKMVNKGYNEDTAVFRKLIKMSNLPKGKEGKKGCDPSNKYRL